MKRYTIRMTHGSLSVNRWDSDSKTPKAIVILLHGMMEHSLRYEQVAMKLAHMGISVIAPDLQGWGESVSVKCPLGSLPEHGWRAYLDDLRGLAAHLTDEEKQLPLFLLGHSMGSFLALHALAHQVFKVNGVICIGSTMVKDGFPLKAGIVLAKLLTLIKGPHRPSVVLHGLILSGFNKGFEPLNSDFDWISSDKEQMQHYLRDVLCGQMGSNWFFHELLKAVQELATPSFLAKIPKTVPILFLTGSQDPLSQGGQRVAQLVTLLETEGIHDLHHEIIPDQRHALLHETKADETLSMIGQWIFDHAKDA